MKARLGQLGVLGVLLLSMTACGSASADDAAASVDADQESIEDRLQEVEDRLDALELSTTSTSQPEPTQAPAPAEALPPPPECPPATTSIPEGYSGEFYLDLVDFPFPAPARVVGSVDSSSGMDEFYSTYTEWFTVEVLSDGCAIGDLEARLRDATPEHGWELVFSGAYMRWEALRGEEEILAIDILPSIDVVNGLDVTLTAQMP